MVQENEPIIAVWAITPTALDASGEEIEEILLMFTALNTTRKESVRVFENADCSGALVREPQNK